MMVWDSDLSFDRVCSISGQGGFKCPAYETCGNIETYLDIPLSSDHLESRDYLSYGIINFDNLGSSLLTVF